MLNFKEPLRPNTIEAFISKGGPSGSSNKYESFRIEQDTWDIRQDDYKVDSFKFSTYKPLQEGEHIKAKVGGQVVFGGQIYKIDSKDWNSYTYEALSYAQRLQTQVNVNFPKAKRASEIVNYFFTKKLVDRTILSNKKVKKTKHKYTGLSFKKKSILEVINQLCWLEYTYAKNIIDFRVSPDGVLYFNSQPSTTKAHVITQAYKMSNSVDYSNIATAYTLYGTKNEKLNTWKNATASKIWGNIYVVDSLQNLSNAESDDVKSVMAKINANFKNYKHTKNGGSCDCRCMSLKIFEQLKSNNITCKIVRYYSASSTSKTHDSVRVKDPKKGWIDFDYTGMDKLYNAIKSRSKTANNVIKSYNVT